MSDALRYEGFIRGAFGLALGKSIDRWGDPASLANTDYFTDSMKNEVKAAVSYSIAIYNHHIIEENNVPESDRALMEKILNDVLSATNTVAITPLIQQYRDSILDKYIKRPI